jgi:F-type H+-transporting ATPase subunit b
MEYHALTLSPWMTGTFWVTVAVLVFAVLFGKRIGSPVAAMLDARADAVRTALDEAAILKAEAEAMLADAKERQAQAMADAKQILASAHAEAERMAEELAAEAQATAKRRERMALDRIAAAEKAALHEVRSIAVDVATTAAAQLLRNGFAANADEAMIDHAISGIPAALHQKV